jgi:uracil-DNA glycosylase
MDESDVYFSALTKCYPGTSVNGKGDRAPTRDEVLNCRPFLAREASCVSAELVLLVGGMAIREFLGAGTLASFVGNAYSIADCPRLAALAVEDASARWVVPLPHCSGASLWLNDAQHKSLLNRALAQIRTLLTHGNPVP